VKGFDELVDGGLPSGRLYVVSGPPGSGKTTFSTQFATRGIRESERCLYFSMHETKEELVEDMRGFEFGFDKAAGMDGFEFINLFGSTGRRLMGENANPTGSGDVKTVTNKLVNFIDQKGVDRVVIDSTMLLEFFFSEESDVFVTFLSQLKRTDATVVLISEMTDPSSYSDEHYLAHGVVFLHNYMEDGGMTRGIQIIKMRGTAIDCDIRQIQFTDSGLEVLDRKVE
jgi:KaiC/GvpD/RAD55 family RecA-like ATPase